MRYNIYSCGIINYEKFNAKMHFVGENQKTKYGKYPGSVFCDSMNGAQFLQGSI